MAFSIEEKSIIKMYSSSTPNRDYVISQLKASLAFVDKDLEDILNNIIGKVNAMTEEAFSALDLSDAL